MSSKFGGNSPYGAAAAASSMARQRHMAPPQIEATLSSNSVTSRHALERLCTFLQTEASKLSHIDLQQQHWVDVHGVATTLCHDEQQLVKRRDRQEQSSGGSDNIKKSKERKEVNRYRHKLERMMADVEDRGGMTAMSSSPSPMAAKHIVFDDQHGADQTPGNDNIRHDAASSQHDDDDDRESRTKKRAKKEKKREEKKAAKRERKEAKKKLKREARESSENR